MLCLITSLHVCKGASLPTLAGNYIHDAYGSGISSLNELAKSWVINYAPDDTQSKTSVCSDYILIGGENIISSGGSIYREYDLLPTHGIIFYSIEIMTIDGWQPGQKLYVSFDSQVQLSFEPANFTEFEGIDKCGSTIKDVKNLIVGSLFHTSTGLTVSITSDYLSNATSAYFGISSFKARLATRKDTDVEVSCASVNNAGSLDQTNVCKCAANQYYDTTLQTCVNCHANCERCFGSSEGECYTCKDGYTYDATSDKCMACSDSDCILCSGSGTNKCQLCASQYLHLDSTCQATCDSPYTSEALDYQFCICPSNTYTEGTQCQSCSLGCSSCTSSNNCVSCDSENGYELVNGACECQSGKYYISGSGCVGNCDSACDTCTSSSSGCLTYKTFDHYTLLLGQDYLNGDLGYYPDNSFSEIAAVCSGDKSCYGFNSDKRTKNALNNWYDSNIRFYRKDGTYSEVAGYTFQQRKDSSLYDLMNIADRNLATMKMYCDGHPYCYGFNTDGYLKQALRPESEWSYDANLPGDSGLYVKTKSYTLITGYTALAGVDSLSAQNLTQISNKDVTTMKLLCDGDPDCFGFNTAGYIKAALGPQSGWLTISNPPPDMALYVKSTPAALAGYTFYQGRDSPVLKNLTFVTNKNLTEMKRICDLNPSCFGFSSLGFVKTKIGEETGWTTRDNSAPDYGLYVKTLQCPDKIYFIADSDCLGNCFNGCKTCTNSSTCQVCMSETSLYTDGLCKCDAPGFYYIDNQESCSGECPNYCNYCQNASLCIECKAGMIWQDSKCQCSSPKLFVAGSCQCPPGTLENPNTTFCDSILFLDIIYQEKVSSYADLMIQAQMTPEEEATFTPIFLWEFDSNGANTTLLASLQTYLTSQTTKNLLVPLSYLEPSKTYTVKASYNNSDGILVFKSVIIQTTGLELQVSIKEGSLQTLDYSIDNTITAEVLSPTGPLSSSLIDIVWGQSGSNMVNLNAFTNSETPYLLSLPKCTFESGKSYNFTISAQQKGTNNTPSTAKLNIITPKPKLIVTIPNGNSGQNSNLSLVIQTNLLFQDPCSMIDVNSILDLSTRQDVWECFKIDAQSISSPCNDTEGIFYPPQGSTSLTIPSSYFSQDIGSELFLKLTVSVKTNSSYSSSSEIFSATTQTSFTIMSPESASVNLAQTIFGVPSEFEVKQETTDSAQYTYTYSWEFTPDVDYAFFEKNLKVRTDLSTLAYLNIPYVRGKMISTRHSASTLRMLETTTTTIIYYQLPINPPPKDGILTISPTSGKSLDTTFFLSATGWTDADIPLSYQFSYSMNETDGYKYITPVQFSSYTYTQLVSNSSQSNVYVKVRVIDSVGSSNSTHIGVYVEPNINVSQVTTKITELLMTKSDMSPMELGNLLNQASESLIILEQTFATAEGCPLCSFQGTCVNNQCICNAGFTLLDCSMTQVQHDSITATKLEVLNVMQEIVSSLAADPSMRETLSQALQSLSSSTDFNHVQTMTNIQNTLETALNLTNPDTILTQAESVAVANTLSNMLSYAGATDSNSTNQFSQNLEDKMNQYLPIVQNSLLAGKLPGEEPTIINTPNFGIYAAKTTPCTMSSENVTISSEYPTLQLSQSNNGPQNCSESVDVTYIAIKADIFDSDPGNKGKTIIALDVRNSNTGKSFPVSAKVLPVGNDQCPVDCDNAGDGCVCIDMFDMKAQFAKVFRKSNIGKLGNISAFVGFEFWKSLASWSAIGFTSWFLISLYFIKFRKPNYNIVDNFQNNKKTLRARLDQGRVLLLVTHPILSIYFFKHFQLSKVTKLILYYQHIIFLLAYTALFPTASKENAIMSKIILIALKSVTITPLSVIITLLIKDLTPDEKRSMTWFRRHKRKIGIVLSTLCSLGCLYIIFIISAQTDFDAQADWTLNFLIVVIQGNVVGPPVVLAVQISFILYMTSKFSNKIPFLKKKVFPKVIDKEIEGLFNRVCLSQEKCITTPTQAPLEFGKKDLEEHENQSEKNEITLGEIPVEIISPDDLPNMPENAYRKVSLPQKMFSGLKFESLGKESPDTSQASTPKSLPFYRGYDSPKNELETDDRPLVRESPFAKQYKNIQRTKSNEEDKPNQIP